MKYRRLHNFQVLALQLGTHNLVVEVNNLSWLAHRISVRTNFLSISSYIVSWLYPMLRRVQFVLEALSPSFIAIYLPRVSPV